MTPTTPRPDLPFPLPDPDAVRAAIDAVDERARLLRRLLRLILRLRLHLTTADRLPNTTETKGAVPMTDVSPLRLVTPPADDRPTPAPALEPLLLSARDLAVLLWLGLRTIRSTDAAGKLPAPVRIGGFVRPARSRPRPARCRYGK